MYLIEVVTSNGCHLFYYRDSREDAEGIKATVEKDGWYRAEIYKVDKKTWPESNPLPGVDVENR